MIDTLALAKARFPGMPNSLDALCRRFAIDLSARTTHNALLDCRLLAVVYVELTGGRQRGLSLAAEKAAVDLVIYTHSGDRSPLPMVPTTEELAAHAAFVGRLRDPVWLRSRAPGTQAIALGIRLDPAPGCRCCHSATKSIGCSSTGGKPPSLVTSERMLRANGNRMRGHSTSSTGSMALSGRPERANTPA